MLKQIIMLFLIMGLFLYGCSGKQKSSKEDSSKNQDLFVEYNAGDFPENYRSIKTIRALKIAEKRHIYKYREQNRHRFFNWSNQNAASDEFQAGARKRLLHAARSAIGTPYVVGGTSPGGFDCSGLVCWAYGNVGVELPRTAREQSVIGRRICNIADMREGDIVAFHHPRRGYHTGIYVGDGKFIHSPRRKTRVKINSLNDPYFSETFLGARRINLTGRQDLLAQAQNKLQPRYTYEASLRRFKQEESRTSRNAGKYGKSTGRIISKKELALLKKDNNKRNHSNNREEVSSKSSKKNRLVATTETSKKNSKRDRSKVTDKKVTSKQDKSAKKVKSKQVTAYDNKHDKKNSKSEKKKKASSKS